MYVGSRFVTVMREGTRAAYALRRCSACFCMRPATAFFFISVLQPDLDKCSDLIDYVFPLSQLCAGNNKKVVPTVFRDAGKQFCISHCMDVLQLHNANISKDPLPSKLREYWVKVADNGEGICQPTGGLLLATLIIASGRSEDLTSLLEEGGLESLVKHVREPAEPTYGTS